MFKILRQVRVICILRFRSSLYIFAVSSPWEADYLFLTRNKKLVVNYLNKLNFLTWSYTLEENLLFLSSIFFFFSLFLYCCIFRLITLFNKMDSSGGQKNQFISLSVFKVMLAQHVSNGAISPYMECWTNFSRSVKDNGLF